MICPYCSTEMEKGKILGDRGPLAWVPSGKKANYWSLYSDDTRLLRNQKVSLLRRTNAEAYACRNCGKLVAETEVNS